MGDVGPARYEPALLPPCPTIRVLSYSNRQKSTHSISKRIFRNLTRYGLKDTLVLHHDNRVHSLQLFS